MPPAPSHEPRSWKTTPQKIWPPNSHETKGEEPSGQPTPRRNRSNEHRGRRNVRARVFKGCMDLLEVGFVGALFYFAVTGP